MAYVKANLTHNKTDARAYKGRFLGTNDKGNQWHIEMFEGPMKGKVVMSRDVATYGNNFKITALTIFTGTALPACFLACVSFVMIL